MLKENPRIEIVPSSRDNELRISIQAKGFQLGKAVLTLCLATAVLSEVLLIYLIVAKLGNIPLVIPAFTALAIVMLSRVWLWYFFGKELIEINENCLSVKRSFGLYTSKEKYIAIDSSVDLYVNKLDNWSWTKLREKGVFRLVKGEEIVDFGITLNNTEYEMLLFQINKLLNKYKNAPVQAPPIASETLPPLPSLEVQHKGKHTEKLRSFYNKYYAKNKKDGKEEEKSTTQKTSAKG